MNAFNEFGCGPIGRPSAGALAGFVALVHSQIQVDPNFRLAAVDAHERNMHWRLAMIGRAAA